MIPPTNTLLSIILLLSFFTIQSQTQHKKGSIYGTIIDKTSKKEISYATITCKDLNNQIITGTITNQKGHFIVQKLPLDSLLVEVQFLGYESLIKKIKLTKENSKLNLGIIPLKEINTSLDEIEIVAEQSTTIQKTDRKVINIGKDLLATGSNSLQMLQNIPSIDVDLQSGSVSLRGNENVRVLINGKPSNLSTSQLLRQTPSSRVKSVEIITSPSAKYTPEGMSGIINLILKKNTKNGLNVSISAGVEHSKETRPDASLNLNYNTGKINFFADISTNIGKNITINDLDRLDDNLTQNLFFLHDYKDFYYKVGADFYINDSNTLSLYSYQNVSNATLLTDTFTQFEDTTLTTPNLSTYKEPEVAYNIDYKWDIDEKGQYLELETNYTINNGTRFDENRLLEDTETKIYNYTNDIIDEQKSWLINLDYATPIFKNGKLELGLEYRNNNYFNSIITDQTIEIGEPATETSVGNTSFYYDRFIYSAYGNLEKDFNKFSIQFGLRAEIYNIDGLFSNTQQFSNTTYTDNTFNLYPSLYITYNLNDDESFNFSYNKRVDRPALYQVSPIQEWTTPLSISIGNQNLEQQFTDSFEINYLKNFSKGSFSLGTFYRNTLDKIGRSIFIDEVNPEITYLSYNNFDTSESFGLEMSANYNAFPWWTLIPSLELYKQEFFGVVNNQQKTVNNTLFKTSFRNNFKISKKLSLQLSTLYRGENENIQYKVDPFTMVNIGARLSILKDKGTISIRGTDIFNGLNYHYTSSNPVTLDGRYDLEVNSIYLGFSYYFEKGLNKTRDRKDREDNESQLGLF